MELGIIALLFLVALSIYFLVKNFPARFVGTDGIGALSRKDILLLNRRLKLFCRWVGIRSFHVQEQADKKFAITFLLNNTTYTPSLDGLDVEEYFRKLAGKIYTDVLFGYEMNFSCVSFKVTNIGLEPKSYIYNFQALNSLQVEV